MINLPLLCGLIACFGVIYLMWKLIMIRGSKDAKMDKVDELKRWRSTSCGGETCRCGEPAYAKVGEEIAHDDPSKRRHNLTAYVCEAHFRELMGDHGVDMVAHFRAHIIQNGGGPSNASHDALALLDIEREELREAASTLRANAACTADPDKAIEHVRDDAARAARSNAT